MLVVLSQTQKYELCIHRHYSNKARGLPRRAADAIDFLCWAPLRLAALAVGVGVGVGVHACKRMEQQVVSRKKQSWNGYLPVFLSLVCHASIPTGPLNVCTVLLRQYLGSVGGEMGRQQAGETI